MEIVKANSRDVHAQGGARNERNAEASANEIEDGEQFAGFLDDAGSETGAAAKVRDVIVEGLGDGAREADEGTVAQTGQTFAGFVGNGTRGGGHEAVGEERAGIELGVSDGQAHDANVDLVVEEGGDLRWRGHVAHLELDERIAATKTENGARENRGNRRNAEADAESAGAAFYCGTRGIEGEAGFSGQFFSERNEHATRFGEGNFAARTGEERTSNFFLEALDLLTEGGLRDERAFRRFAEVQFFGKDEERAQFIVLQIHNRRLSQPEYRFIGRKTAFPRRILLEARRMASGRHKSNGSGSRRTRAVIMDFGEVLCFRPAPEAMGRMAKLFRIAPERFLECYVPTRGPYDQGLLTPEEYWMDFARVAGVTIDAALVEELRRTDTAMWSRINVEMTDWVEQLHEAGLTTALLSNMQHDMAAHARKNFDWLRHFDHQILSCELRLIKPDGAIFRHTIEQIGVRAEEMLFVDDREANVEAARAVGLRAIQFESTEQLRLGLREIGFEPLPPTRKTQRRAVATKTKGKN